MDRLEQIKNAVTANGMREWTDERVNQVSSNIPSPTINRVKPTF